MSTCNVPVAQRTLEVTYSSATRARRTQTGSRPTLPEFEALAALAHLLRREEAVDRTRQAQEGAPAPPTQRAARRGRAQHARPRQRAATRPLHRAGNSRARRAGRRRSPSTSSPRARETCARHMCVRATRSSGVRAAQLERSSSSRACASRAVDGAAVMNFYRPRASCRAPSSRLRWCAPTIRSSSDVYLGSCSNWM